MADDEPLFRPDVVRAALVRMGSMSKAVQDMMEQEESLHFEFCVVNNRVTYTHPPTAIPRDWLAVAMIRAVEEWKLVPEEYDAVRRFGGSNGTNGTPVKYNYHITFNWLHKEIRTSIPSDAGDEFLQVAAYFVGEFQRQHENEQRRAGRRGTA